MRLDRRERRELGKEKWPFLKMWEFLDKRYLPRRENNIRLTHPISRPLLPWLELLFTKTNAQE